MAITFNTTDPAGLLKAIEDGIKNGDIDTWVKHTSEKIDYFTHAEKSKQWHKKAFLKAYVDKDNSQLKFGIHGLKDVKLKRIYYAVYHGRFIQMVLDHFEKKFTDANASSKKTAIDIFTPE